MAPTRILILSDGRPGHFNLSEGIAAAIERIGPATTVRHDIRRGGWPGHLLAAMTRVRLPARTALRRVYDIDEKALPQSDVIVSAGAETLAANIWLARIRAVPGIFYGSLRLYDPRDFTLVLTSYARNAGKPRHALALKPSRLDPDSLGPPRRGRLDGSPTFGLLIGGDAGPIRYTGADWTRLLDFVSAMSQNHGVAWLLANSRRTPGAVSDELARRAAGQQPKGLEFLDVRSAGAGTLAALLARCDAVFCTADSSSMISECVWARRPTIALAPALCGFTADEAAYRGWLAEAGWCRQMDLDGLNPEAVRQALASVTPLQRNPQAELAELIRARVFGSRD